MTISDLTDLSSPQPVVKWSEAWWENAKPEVRAHRCKAHGKKRRQMQTSRNRRCKRVSPTRWTRTAGPCKSSAPLGRSNRHDGPCAAEDGYRWDLGVRHLAPHRRPSHISVRHIYAEAAAILARSRGMKPGSSSSMAGSRPKPGRRPT